MSRKETAGTVIIKNGKSKVGGTSEECYLMAMQVWGTIR
jgi:hypothetical protein